MLNLDTILHNLRNISIPQGILSVYLSFDQIRSPSEDALDSLTRSLINTLPPKQQEQFKPDIERILNYLQQHYSRSNIRSLVFFTSGKNLWKVLELAFYLPASISVSKQPNIKPLEEKLPDYRRYMVLLVDRKKAKAFTVYLGKLEKQVDLHSDEIVPHRVKAEKYDTITGREDKIFRNIEDSLHRYLKDIASQAWAFFKLANQVDFILLAGHKEIFAKIHRHLPKIMADKVKDGFVTQLNIPLNQIVQRSKKVAQKLSETD